jgi:hypothetical protein
MKRENDDVNRQIDIGLKKTFLKETYGADFHQHSELDPSIEMAWLESIEVFEQQFNSCNTIPLYEYIGCPDYKKPNELAISEVSDELKKLMELMAENGIDLSANSRVDDAELYRFIVEELFLHQMNNMRIKGMITGFIYEEFHPNAEDDIQMCYDYFWSWTMAKKEGYGDERYDLLYVDKEGFVSADGQPISKDDLSRRINTFLDAFDYFKVVDNSIVQVVINDLNNDAELRCSIHYKGCFHKRPEMVTFKGEGVFKCHPCKFGGWSIYSISMPGLEI